MRSGCVWNTLTWVIDYVLELAKNGELLKWIKKVPSPVLPTMFAADSARVVRLLLSSLGAILRRADPQRRRAHAQQGRHSP